MFRSTRSSAIRASRRPTFPWSHSRLEKKNSPDSTPSRLLGHLAAWNYFESIKSAGNTEFIKKWQAFTKNPKRVTNDPMEAHVIGFNMWVKAVEKAKSTDADKVIDALPGIEAANLTGGTSKMLPNHHITKPVFIGEIRGGRPVRRRVEDHGSRPGRRLVRLPAGLARISRPTG